MERRQRQLARSPVDPYDGVADGVPHPGAVLEELRRLEHVRIDVHTGGVGGLRGGSGQERDVAAQATGLRPDRSLTVHLRAGQFLAEEHVGLELGEDVHGQVPSRIVTGVADAVVLDVPRDHADDVVVTLGQEIPPRESVKQRPFKRSERVR
jgi:hypothetical protein